VRWLSLSKARILTSLRSKNTIFWSVFFPILMLIVMIAIFGNIQNTSSNVKFTFGIERESQGMWSNIIYKVFESIEKNNNFRFFYYKSREKLLKDLKNKKINCAVIIPKNFDSTFLVQSEPIKIEYNGSDDVSKISKYVMDSIITSLNIKATEYTGKEVKIVKNRILNLVAKDTSKKNNFNITNYFFAGIMIMAILTIGSFNVPISLIWEKQRGITKRFMVTPLKSSDMFSAIILEFMFLVLIQFVLLSFTSIVFFKGNPKMILSLPVLYYILYTSLLSISMGFFVASISKTPGSANAIGNIIFFPFQFLGGLYFPVLNVPNAIKWIVIGNPITYLASGMRSSMGIMPNPFSMLETITIPLIWLVFFSMVGIYANKKVGERN
jgi:ABC-2 type transport system permease protein